MLMENINSHIFSANPYIRKKSTLTPQQLHSIGAYLDDLLLKDSAQVRKTHYFHGRYENIYLEQYQHPDLELLMDESRQLCAQLLNVKFGALSLGFWFNLMGPGHITDWHTHDDMDELISGVVYLTVPDKSGDLILKTGDEKIILEPVAGNFIFFDPCIPHAVSENLSPFPRLSIGMNIGLTENKQAP